MKFTRAQGSLATRRGFAAVALVAVLVAVALAVGSADAFEERQEDWPAEVVAAPPQQDPQAREPEANLPYLFAVFIITWAGFFAYAFIMSRRQREMQREIEALKRILGENEEREVGSSPS